MSELGSVFMTIVTIHEQKDRDTRAQQHMHMIILDKYMHSSGPDLCLPLPSAG